MKLYSISFFTCVILLLTLLNAPCLATNYYLSNDGDDLNKGISPELAWQSIDRLNKQGIEAGDSVFFRKGDVFRGQINLIRGGDNTGVIFISSYGTGPSPVISGAQILTDWEKFKNNIYVTSFGKYIRDVYQNNDLKTIARYPNQGFLTIDYNSDYLHFTDNALIEKNGYWNGANARIRTKNWVYEIRKIRDFRDKTVYLEKHPDFPIEKGFEYRHTPDGNSTIYKLTRGDGYYLDNKFELLDTLNEWYQNSDSKQVFYYSDKNPLQLEATVLDYGVLIKKATNIVIVGLHFDKYSKAAIHVEGMTTNLIVKGNKITNISRFGINLGERSSHCKIKDNFLKNISGRGITATQLSNSVIKGNTIKNVGLVPGYGWSGNFSTMGILLNNLETKIQEPPYCHDNIISYNNIDSIGYSGIRMDGNHSVCESNIVNNCMLTLNDGGAVYCYARQPGVTYNSVFRKNIIMNTHGNTESVPGDHNMAIALYLDNNSHDMLIEDNTILNNTSTGIVINDASFNNTIKGNNLYNNETGIVFSEWKTIGGIYGNEVSSNTIYCKTQNQKAISIANSKVGVFIPGKLSKNYYSSLTEKFYFHYQTYHNSFKNIKELNLEGWQQETGQDINSISIALNKVDTYKDGAKIFYNSTLQDKKIDLSDGEYYNFKEEKMPSDIILEPFSSIILLKAD